MTDFIQKENFVAKKSLKRDQIPVTSRDGVTGTRLALHYKLLKNKIKYMKLSSVIG